MSGLYMSIIDQIDQNKEIHINKINENTLELSFSHYYMNFQ